MRKVLIKIIVLLTINIIISNTHIVNAYRNQDIKTCMGGNGEIYTVGLSFDCVEVDAPGFNKKTPNKKQKKQKVEIKKDDPQLVFGSKIIPESKTNKNNWGVIMANVIKNNDNKSILHRVKDTTKKVTTSIVDAGKSTKKWISTQGEEVKKKSKHGWFFIRHPKIALKIGTAKSKKNNISVTSSNFAINTRLNNNALIMDEGSRKNALRHVFWQAEITRQFGEDIAKKVGNAHEIDHKAIDGDKINVLEFSTVKKADESVDLRNNIIGREIGSLYPNKTNQELTIIILDYFKNNGLWVFKEESNGTYLVFQEKLNQENYNNAINLVKLLDKNGKMIKK